MKISFTGWFNITPSTSINPNQSNNSTLNLIYEKDDTTVVFVSLNYLTGSFNKEFSIKKSSGTLVKIMAANVHQSPLFYYNSSQSFESIHFVLKQNQTDEAIELRIDLSGKNNHKIFNYTANGLPPSSELIGISSASSSVLSKTN